MIYTTLEYTPQQVEAFRTLLLKWFATEKRKLPFRETKSPYHIWISEIMAQQTQIDTLIPYYHRFTEAFPTVEALAAASEDQVLKLWEGLGYYSRARNLHKAAKVICGELGGVFPNRFEELIKLPGIGPYTGGAIASIAFNEKVPAVDGNVLRVVTRITNYNGDIADTKIKNAVTAWVKTSMPETPGDYNEALMELGALVCTPKNPMCILCPVREQCLAQQQGTVSQLPVKSKKIKQKRLSMEVAIVDYAGNLFFVKRPETGLLSTLWGFPIVEAAKTPETALRELLSEDFPMLPQGKLIGKDKHVFSHIIWDMSVYYYALPETYCCEATISYASQETCFKNRSTLGDITLPVAFSKLLKLL